MHSSVGLARRFQLNVFLTSRKGDVWKWFWAHGVPRSPSVKLAGACLVGLNSTREKNTLEMNKVKRHILGRPPRSQSEVDLQALGQRVRQIRGAETQKEFALALHISQAQLSKYELGQSALPLSLVVKLAERSGRTTDWILTGKS